MALVVKNNMQATGTLNQLDKNADLMAKDLKKVSSGMKVNSAEDDASGYSIGEKMDVQIRGLAQDSQNTQSGNSMLRTAEGAIQSTVDILRTLKEKAINAANDTNTDLDRATIQKEVNTAIDQIDENANVTYNGVTMLDGSKNGPVAQPGTLTSLSNSSFSDKVTMSSPLTDLKARDGDSLGIQVGDRVAVSFVQQGKTYSHTTKVKENTWFGDVFDWAPLADRMTVIGSDTWIGDGPNGERVYTPDMHKAITYRAAVPGLAGQIAGLTVSVYRADGTPRVTANTVINNFTETIRAQNPSPDNALSFQIGTKANQSVKVGFTDLRAEALGLRAKDGSCIQLTTAMAANAAISAFDNALSKVLDEQTKVGSVEDRLDYTGANLATENENTTASMSTIRDANMAKEMTEYTKHSILTQTAQAMLAQANTNGSSVLSLLKE